MTDVVALREAKARGLTRYFTGEPCRRGHVTERFVVNRRCIACHNAWNSGYAKANPDEHIARLRAWRAKHRAREAARNGLRSALRRRPELVPEGITLEMLEPLYAERIRRESETGEAHDVGHVVYLFQRGEHVVPNLRPLTRRANRARAGRLRGRR